MPPSSHIHVLFQQIPAHTTSLSPETNAEKSPISAIMTDMKYHQFQRLTVNYLIHIAETGEHTMKSPVQPVLSPRYGL